jgi:hypothetical protein
VATYQFDPIIQVNDDVAAALTMPQRQLVVDSCPVKVRPVACSHTWHCGTH